MRRTLSALLFGSAAPAPVLAELLLLVSRLVFGLALALAHGWGKLPPAAKFVERVGSMGFPQPTLFAWLSALAEFAGGLLLAAGLLTRPAAFVIAFNMGVAAFLAHAADPFRAREQALLFFAGALVFVARGGGRFALDRVVARRA